MHSKPDNTIHHVANMAIKYYGMFTMSQRLNALKNTTQFITKLKMNVTVFLILLIMSL